MIRIGLWAIRRPWLALGLWLAFVIPLGYNALSIEDQLGPPSITTDGSESDRADRAAADTFGRQTSIPILLTGPRRAVERQSRRLSRELRAITPLDPRTPAGLRRILRPDPHSLVLLAALPTPSAIDDGAADKVDRVIDRTITPPVQAAISGFSPIGRAFADESVKAVQKSEKIAIPILLIILLIVFRSPVAAAVPLILGIGSTVSGIGLLGVFNAVHDIAEIALSVCSLMSLALGVDYSLLMLSRFREELRHGREPDAAARAAVQTAGSTVVFAALAILIVMVGLLFAAPGGNAVTAAAGPICGAVAALFSALVALPALISLLGDRVNRYRIGPPQSDDGGRWGQVARWAQRRPRLALVPALLVLALLGPLAIGLDTGPPDPRTLPAASPARGDAERVAAAVGPGLLSPFVIDATPLSPRASVAFARRLARDPDVLTVLAPTTSTARSPALRAATRHGPTRRFIVMPETGANTPRTAALYDRLQADARRLPARTAFTGGIAAQLTDSGRDVASGFVPLIVVIVTLTALLMMVALRAIPLPLVCVAINLVSVVGAMGIVALLCTGEDPLLGGPGFADNTALLGVFSIIFALSLDYQVFILERIREEWERTGSVQQAVTGAIDQTARVITGAAAILIGVFGAFMIPELQTIRQSGVGLVVAILIDATLVRLVLLPAAITLMGPRSFWLPEALRITPHNHPRGDGGSPRPAVPYMHDSASTRSAP